MQKRFVNNSTGDKYSPCCCCCCCSCLLHNAHDAYIYLNWGASRRLHTQKTGNNGNWMRDSLYIHIVYLNIYMVRMYVDMEYISTDSYLDALLKFYFRPVRTVSGALLFTKLFEGLLVCFHSLIHTYIESIWFIKHWTKLRNLINWLISTLTVFPILYCQNHLYFSKSPCYINMYVFSLMIIDNFANPFN